jgi:L-ascorbate metabolism protein UlaG (beta-lactamase superfamily)
MCSGVALARQMEVLWLGHSAFRFTSTKGKVIVIDPFLTKNPKAPENTRILKISVKSIWFHYARASRPYR